MTTLPANADDPKDCAAEFPYMNTRSTLSIVSVPSVVELTLPDEALIVPAPVIEIDSASDPCLPSNVSLPACPWKESSPSPPITVSANGDPVMVTLPWKPEASTSAGPANEASSEA